MPSNSSLNLTSGVACGLLSGTRLAVFLLAAGAVGLGTDCQHPEPLPPIQISDLERGKLWEPSVASSAWFEAGDDLIVEVLAEQDNWWLHVLIRTARANSGIELGVDTFDCAVLWNSHTLPFARSGQPQSGVMEFQVQDDRTLRLTARLQATLTSIYPGEATHTLLVSLDLPADRANAEHSVRGNQALVDRVPMLADW